MKICIINPNSSEDMTQVIGRNAKQFASDFDVECIRNESAPPFIGSYEDIQESIPGMVKSSAFPFDRAGSDCNSAHVYGCFG